MMSLKVGDQFPNALFKYIPYTDPDVKACGIPINLTPAKEFAGEEFVIVAVPGAFTPTCTANHIPPYIERVNEFVKKGVKHIIVISANDAFVLSAWGKVLGSTSNEIIFASDPNAEFSKSIGFSQDLTEKGLGIRTSRYAIVVDKNGKVKYIEKETSPTVDFSSAETVLSKL